MIRLIEPINAVVGCPIIVGPYTFRNARTKRTIDLSVDFVAVSVVCQLKRRDSSGYEEVGGTIVSAVNGIVQVDSHIFDEDWEWEYQFFAVNASGFRLAGEAVRFIVKNRIQDLAASEVV